MIMKKLLILIVLVVAGYYIWKIPKTVEPVMAPVVNETPIAEVAGVNTTFSRETDTRSIKAVYPQNAPAAVAAQVDGIVERFERDTNEMLNPQETARLIESGRKYTLDITTDVHTSALYTSYVLKIYEDTGGAHPNGSYSTLTFNPEGAQVELAGLFKPNARYLDRLSKISYDFLVKDLAKRFNTPLDEQQKDMVRMGTSPSPESLQFFYIDGENLVLMFPPYQVAAYAAGSSEVKIPLADLKDILK